MKLKSILTAGLTLCVFTSGAAIVNAAPLTPKEELGKFLYFDEDLSDPSGQSCSSCHHPQFAFVDPDSQFPVSEGVIPGLFGGRNSPSAAYAMYAPIFYFDAVEGLWIGGQFWDGRATGEALGDPLADQALGPFLNPVEMANPDKATVIADVVASGYSALFETVWGPDSLDDIEAAYDQVALSIAAFERTALFAPFDSKYDAYLEACLGNAGDQDDCAQGIGKTAEKTGKKIFTKEEWNGMQLFMGDAMCVACHVVDWPVAAVNVVVPAWSPEGFVPPMFTDFTFDNLGVPQNTEFPLDPNAPVDLGLGGFLSTRADVSQADAEAENGKFKVMSLRNIGDTGPYAHNGLFKTLKEITHFYNTRDVPGSLPKGEDWAPPEYPTTVNSDELGNLMLSDDDEDAIVKFMKTLSDGYRP